MTDCTHERVQWVKNNGVCLDCGDSLDNLGDQILPSACQEKGGPVSLPPLSGRDIRAEALREDRFQADPFIAKPERRLSP